jgi:hypothetical protein
MILFLFVGYTHKNSLLAMAEWRLETTTYHFTGKKIADTLHAIQA